VEKVLMKKTLIVLLVAAACGGGPTSVETTAKVRFVNATTGLSGNSAFTANGQVVAGSAVAFGQFSQTCATMDAGSTSFGFGAGTLGNQMVEGGGNYIMVATGSATSPQLYLLDNNFSGQLTSNQAAARFLNLAPGPNTLPNIFYAFSSWPPTDTSALFAGGLLVGNPSTFKATASGSSNFYTIIGHDMETLDTHAVNLSAGSLNTLAILPNASSRYQLINIPRC
jgi:hypothetical protein